MQTQQIEETVLSLLRPYVRKATKKRLCIFDSETDPFKKGRTVIKPFTCGFLDLSTGDYNDFWGADCIAQFFAWLEAEYTAKGIECIIFCHNFGGFDCHFMIDQLDPGSNPSIINKRISSCYMGGQEFRDSYRIIPIALKVYQKDDFDYALMEPECREANKPAILHYQRMDCVYLGDLVREYFELFGDRPTVGNTAINYLQSFHSFKRLRAPQDAKLRPFFFGGRTQCFETGVLKGRFFCYDVHSMYPSVMHDQKHPTGNEFIIGRTIGKLTAFVEWEGTNYGAVPIRRDDGSLDFTSKRGRFKSTVHEISAGLETGTIKIDRIIQTIGFRDWSDFAEFIDYCYEQRMIAAANGDKLRVLFWKFMMNSGWGKFAQDPSKYENYTLSVDDRGIPEPADMWNANDNDKGWRVAFNIDTMNIWSRPSSSRYSGFFNVATGASITGAARAKLLRGISKAKRPIYCDTDSIVCEEFSGEIHGSKLGTWDLECSGEVFACAGKKLYAIFSTSIVYDKISGKEAETAMLGGVKLWCVKKASKGAVLTAAEILKVAQGDVVRYESDRPNFKLGGATEFIARDIRITG